jgi:hypothetical protein
VELYLYFPYMPLWNGKLFSFTIPKELLVQEIHTTIRMVLTDRKVMQDEHCSSEGTEETRIGVYHDSTYIKH